MSELRSALEPFQNESLADVSDQRLEEDFAELHRISEMLEVERLRRLAEIDRRRTYERDGHLNTAAWLASTFKMGWGKARDQVKIATALEEMPKTRKALDEAELSTSAVQLLVATREADPEAFRESEAELVEAARIHSMQDLRRVTRYWEQGVQNDQALTSDEKIRERRRLRASIKFLGMVHLDGDLDPETGETLLTALRAVLDAESKTSRTNDDRTPEQRRADALGEICRQWLDSTKRPTVGGERPHVTVTVGEEALKGVRGDTSELDHVGAVGPETARRLACDASIRRVVMAGPSEPLDVGRKTPVISPALRRAVIVRDRTCRYPGCDRPHTWCEVHHIVHWADGGPTCLENTLLLCRRHHHLIHKTSGFKLNLEDGKPVFRRPDGSSLENRAPP